MARLFTGAEVIEAWNPLDEGEMPEFIPVEWNGPHVGIRLIDAWRTLIKVPMPRFAPQGFGSTWPQYRIEWTDLLSMIGGGEIEALERSVNRVRVLPSAKEISQMEKAIMWPLQYLKDAREVLIVNVCARIHAIEGSLQREIRRRRYGGDADQWRKKSWTLHNTIADGLIRDRVLVF